jgi:uncharacterized protein (TIGR02117 family)
VKRLLTTIGKGLTALLLVFVVTIVITARSGNSQLFPATVDAVEVTLVSNGYHAGLAVPRKALLEQASTQGLRSLISVSTRFQHYGWVEVGWGDAEFYQSTPTPGDIQVGLAAKALLGLGEGAVLHVVGLEEPPEKVFSGADLMTIRLSPEGFARLAARMNSAFVNGPEGQNVELGPGLYGPSLFYLAKGHFSLLNVCNHWIADLLDAAGVPTAPAISVLPHGLIADLKLRSGL